MESERLKWMKEKEDRGWIAEEELIRSGERGEGGGRVGCRAAPFIRMSGREFNVVEKPVGGSG